MNADQLSRLSDLVYRHSGLKLDHLRREDIVATLDLMKAAIGASDLSDLFTKLEHLSTHHPIWQMLLRRVTIGETYFFRNMSQYEALRQEILPSIIEQRRKYGLRHLNLWSAGCASGEEPYSIAILLRELLPDIENWNISLLGTDINTVALETARKAVYRDHSFRSETRPDIRERYFHKTNGNWELDPVIRRMVTFAPLNLISDKYPSFLTRTSHLDLIICRNVTIYFDEETTRGVVSRFHESLLENGWLIVGHAEPLASVYQGFAPRNFEGTVVYQKAPVQQIQDHSFPAQPAVRIKLPASPPAPQNRPLSKPDTTRTTQTSVVKAELVVPTLQDIKEAADRENWDRACVMFKEMERSYGLNPAFHYWRGLVLMHKEEWAEARQALRRSLYCDSNFAMSHYLLGEIALQQKNRKEARRCWQQALQAIANREENEAVMESDALTVAELRGLIETHLLAGAL